MESSITVNQTTAIDNQQSEVKTKGQLLREARIAAGLTQQQLAEKSGVRRGQISQIESGRAGVTKERGRMLAVALNLKEDFLDIEYSTGNRQDEFIDFVRNECMFDTDEVVKQKISEKFGILPSIETMNGYSRVSANINGKQVTIDIKSEGECNASSI